MTWLSELPYNYLQCRDLRHAWKPYTAEYVSRKRLKRVMVCDRCPAIKTQVMTHTGKIVSTSMSYPDDYLRPRGAGRITSEENAQMRLESFRREM